MDSNRPGLGEERPSLVHKGTSSRRLVDFDSEQLLSMEEIRDNVRLTASRLLNDDLDSSDEEAYDDEHDQGCQTICRAPLEKGQVHEDGKATEYAKTHEYYAIHPSNERYERQKRCRFLI